jgi:16S rRNA (adenine(1408)-N(1))-methyltransferase
VPHLNVEPIAGVGDLTASHSLLRLQASPFNICDVGAGDGKFALRLSRAHPQAVVVALDAEATRMRKVAQRLKGRAPANLLFWTLSMDDAVSGTSGLFDEIHVVLPWGSLLDGMVGFNDVVLGHVLDLGRPGARLSVVLNCRPWRQGHGALRTERLPSPSDPEVMSNMTRFLTDRGWVVGEWARMDEAEARKIESSWARRLASSQPPEYVRFTAARVNVEG